ncbi:MAG: copper-binding protein [Nitrosopumilus sp.]|nr:copper-binding protein [Nitrosopumilus sp.]MDA7955348.1 copper-binding protein [Nitrosopumilus sp.]
MVLALVVAAALAVAVLPALAETQTLPTERGTLDVRLTHDVIELDKRADLKVEFVNKVTGEVQIHIDYTAHVQRGGEDVFGPTPPQHSTSGVVEFPVYFDLGNGPYTLNVTMSGILFNPLPPEDTVFEILVGEAAAEPDPSPKTDDPPPGTPPAQGGCLIATAAYGTEMAAEVQQLRELRDRVVMGTGTGASFMGWFNDIYYSFSPAVADLQREHPIFREVVRASLVPLVSSLSLLHHAGIETDAEMLGYGISLILLNIGTYAGIPIFAIIKLYKKLGVKN